MSQKCYRCGFSWPHKTKPCPTTDAICRQCGTMGHFAKVCKGRPKSQSHTVPQPCQHKCQCPKRTHPSTSIRQIQKQEESHQ